MSCVVDTVIRYIVWNLGNSDTFFFKKKRKEKKQLNLLGRHKIYVCVTVSVASRVVVDYGPTTYNIEEKRTRTTSSVCVTLASVRHPLGYARWDRVVLEGLQDGKQI